MNVNNSKYVDGHVALYVPSIPNSAILQSCHILIRAEFSSMPPLGNKHFAALLGGLGCMEYPLASHGSFPRIKKKIAFKHVAFNVFWQKITKDDFYFNAFS